jgi:hypothetical protein
MHTNSEYEYRVQDIATAAILEQGNQSWEWLHRRFPGLIHSLKAPPEKLRTASIPKDAAPWSFSIEETASPQAILVCKRKMNSGNPLGSGEAQTEVCIRVPVALE